MGYKNVKKNGRNRLGGPLCPTSFETMIWRVENRRERSIMANTTKRSSTVRVKRVKVDKDTIGIVATPVKSSNVKKPKKKSKA